MCRSRRRQDYGSLPKTSQIKSLYAEAHCPGYDDVFVVRLACDDERVEDGYHRFFIERAEACGGPPLASIVGRVDLLRTTATTLLGGALDGILDRVDALLLDDVETHACDDAVGGAARPRRTDLDFHPPYASLVPAVGRVHAEIFVEVAYAAPPVFYAAFGNCVDRLIKPWFARGDGFGFSRRNSTRPVYVPLNWTNALESDLTALRWRWLHVPERLGGAIAAQRFKRVIFDHLPELEGARTGEPAVLADAMEACAVNEFASALCGQFGLFSSETFMAYAILQAAPACLIAGRQNLSPGNLYSLAEDRHAFTWAADDDEACPYAGGSGAARRTSCPASRRAQRAWPYKVLSLGAGAGRKGQAPHLERPGTQAFSCLLYARDPADNRTGGGLELYENFVPDGAKYPAPADIALGRVIPYAANRLVCNLNLRAAVHASEPSAGDLTTPRRFLLYRAGLEEPLFSFKEGSQAH
ncbi:phytanoyl-CoA dioxygenase [Aureococcus anophagefferens]|nr:phytanoyl-CoA dioxygenase [Aureococcus anophagefferens]